MPAQEVRREVPQHREDRPRRPRGRRHIGPGGEFDWPDYDPEVHGVVTCCEPVDKPSDPPASKTPASGGQAPPARTPAPSTPATAADPDKEPRS